MNQTEVKTRLRETAGDVIRTATAMIDAVSHGAEPIGMADPEPWTIKRMYARRILQAIDSGGPDGSGAEAPAILHDPLAHAGVVRRMHSIAILRGGKKDETLLGLANETP